MLDLHLLNPTRPLVHTHCVEGGVHTFQWPILFSSSLAARDLDRPVEYNLRDAFPAILYFLLSLPLLPSFPRAC